MDMYEQALQTVGSAVDWYVAALAQGSSGEGVLNRADADQIADLSAKFGAVANAQSLLRHTILRRRERSASGADSPE